MRQEKCILPLLVLLCATSIFVKADSIFTFGTINPFREFQTAASTQIMQDEGCSLFTRLYFKKSKTSETGTAVLEFPLYQNIVAGLNRLTVAGFQPFWGKLLNIVTGLIAYILYFFLIRTFTESNRIALLSTFLITFSAITIMYERAFMIDIMAFSFSIAGLYFFLQNLRSRKNSHLLLGILFSTLSLLIKPPFGIVIFLPYLVAILSNNNSPRLRLIASGIIIPGVITLAWLILSEHVNKANGFHILPNTSQKIDWYIGSISLRFSSYWMMILRNIYYNVTSPIGCVFLVIGLSSFLTKIRKYRVAFAWLVSGLIYIMFFFRIQSHVYYILPFLPVIAFLMALGIDWTIFKTKDFLTYKNVHVFSLAIVALFYFYFFLHNLPRAYANAGVFTNPLSPNRSLPSPRRYLPKLGNSFRYPYRDTIDKITKEDDLILYVWGSGWISTNGFLSRRYGENLGFHEITKTHIDEYIEKGFKYAFVYSGFQPNEHLYLTRFRLAFNDPDKFRIYDLSEFSAEYEDVLRSHAEEVEETKKTINQYFVDLEQIETKELFVAHEVNVGGKAGESLANPNLYVEETCYLPTIDEGFYILRFEYRNTPDARPIVVVTPWTGEFHMNFTRHIPLISACTDEYYRYGEIFYVPEEIKIMHPRLILRNHNQGKIHFRQISLLKIINARARDKVVNEEDYVITF